MEKETHEINFCTSSGTIPTVELDLESLPEEGMYGYGEILFNILSQLARKKETIKATIYAYHANSINFMEPTSSVFFGICGDKIALETIYSELHALPDIRCRYSDYILVSHNLLQFHIEDGVVWRPLDAVTWFDGIEDN